MKKRGRHDTLCALVADELKTRGWKVTVNEEYNHHGVRGEYDVLGQKQGRYMYVECKTSYTKSTYKKSEHQTRRARDNPLRGKPLYRMMAYFKRDEIHYKWLMNHWK